MTLLPLCSHIKKKNPTGTKMKHLEILNVTVVMFSTNHQHPSSPLFSLDDIFQANSGGKLCLSSFYSVLKILAKHQCG